MVLCAIKMCMTKRDGVIVVTTQRHRGFIMAIALTMKIIVYGGFVRVEVILAKLVAFMIVVQLVQQVITRTRM